MDVLEFQKKLNEICQLASENGKTLLASQIKETFSGMDLKKEQLLKVLSYLKQKGISIEGMEMTEQEEEKEEERPAVPLTEEEQVYLEEYKRSLAGFSPSEKPLEELLAELLQGKEEAKSELTGRYLETVAQLAVKMNSEEIFLADLIQEGNLSLLAALNQEQQAVHDHEWLFREIRQGLKKAVDAQVQRKIQDDSLVEKVQNLEAAVKDLTEDGEENKFTINELAIILDMDVEEIRDILRLTGDDK